jgi:glyoxylase-like metal-dependent hydrolase (beta-lactamase superfamily II)
VRDALRWFIRRGRGCTIRLCIKVNELTLRPATIAAFVAFAMLAGAQQQAAPLKVTKIKDNLYWAQGGAGSNDGIIVGTTGVIVVDTKTTPDSEKEVIAEIAKITPKTVNTAIITHSDGDHVNGLAAFPDGLTIIAQENCKKEMEASAGSRNPAPQDRLPTKTYNRLRRTSPNLLASSWIACRAAFAIPHL